MIRSECSTSSWMIRICSARDRLALFERPLQRESRVVDNGERVLDLMRELGRDTPRGAQLAFAHRELARFLHRPPLPFQQHLHAVAADRHQQQQRQAQRQRLGRVFRRCVEPRFSLDDHPGLGRRREAPKAQVSAAARTAIRHLLTAADCVRMDEAVGAHWIGVRFSGGLPLALASSVS